MTQFVCDSRGVHEIQNATLADPDPWMWQAFGSTKSDSPVPVTPMSILGHPPIWQGINILAGDCAYLPRILKKRIGSKRTEEDRRHVAYHLFAQRANPIMLADTFWELMVSRSIIHGNALAEIARDGNGKPLPGRLGGLTPLTPETTWPEYDDNGRLWIKTRMQIQGEQQTRFIDPVDTIHIKGLSTNGFWGLSLRQIASNTIGYGLGLQKHGNVTFKNRARPDVLISHPGHLSDKAADHFRVGWSGIHAGLDNVSRAAILEEGMTVQPFAQSNEDAQWIDAQKFDIQQSARILDLPSPMLNDLERATFANIEELRLWYVNGRLAKLQRRITGECQAKLLTEREQEQWFFLFNNDILLKGKLKERYEAYTKAISSMWLSRNEVREEEGYDPEDGLDEFVNPNTTSGGGTDGLTEDRLRQVEERQARLLIWSLRDCLHVEDQMVRRAAESEKNVVKWLQDFYVTQMPGRLMTLVSDDAAYEYCTARHDMVLTLTGQVSSSEMLVSAFDKTTGLPENRARQLTNRELLPCV